MEFLRAIETLSPSPLDALSYAFCVIVLAAAIAVARGVSAGVPLVVAHWILKAMK